MTCHWFTSRYGYRVKLVTSYACSDLKLGEKTIFVDFALKFKLEEIAHCEVFGGLISINYSKVTSTIVTVTGPLGRSATTESPAILPIMALAIGDFQSILPE